MVNDENGDIYANTTLLLERLFSNYNGFISLFLEYLYTFDEIYILWISAYKY